MPTLLVCVVSCFRGFGEMSAAECAAAAVQRGIGAAQWGVTAVSGAPVENWPRRRDPETDMRAAMSQFADIDDASKRLASVGYLPSRDISTSAFLMDRLEKPVPDLTQTPTEAQRLHPLALFIALLLESGRSSFQPVCPFCGSSRVRLRRIIKPQAPPPRLDSS